MLFVIVTGLATGALFAATALVYNVMFSTSKVLSLTTGHLAMLGGVFGAWFMQSLQLPWWLHFHVQGSAHGAHGSMQVFWHLE